LIFIQRPIAETSVKPHRTRGGDSKHSPLFKIEVVIKTLSALVVASIVAVRKDRAAQPAQPFTGPTGAGAGELQPRP
jgi:hypothetical protein